MTTSPKSTAYSQITPWLRAMGLGLALYLGFLGVLRLPCPGGGCDAVLHSRWGAWVGVPVGFFGAALWAMTFVSRPAWRAGAHHLLAVGSIGFVVLQAGVIGRFCPWCLAHALLCWLAWPGRSAPGARIGPLCGGLGLAALLLGLQIAWRQPVSMVKEAATIADLSGLGFDWLRLDAPGPAPVVVISLTCPLCLDLLSSIPAPAENAPKLVMLVSDENRELTELFVAAILAHPAGEGDSFPAMAALLLTQRELVLSRPGDAARWFAFSQPEAGEKRTVAAARIEAQQLALQRAGIGLTPVWVSPAGTVGSIIRWPGVRLSR